MERLSQLGEWKYIADGHYPDIRREILACTHGGSYIILKDYIGDGVLRNVWTGNKFANRDVFTGKTDNFENIYAWTYLENAGEQTVCTIDGQFVKERHVKKHNENYLENLGKEDEDEED